MDSDCDDGSNGGDWDNVGDDVGDEKLINDK